MDRSDIELAYRLFLHREPDSNDVVASFLRVESREALYKTFLDSEEFKAKFSRTSVPLEWPPNPVQVDVEPAMLQPLVAHVERTWRGLGEADPYWSVISRPEFRREAFAANAAGFRESGRADVERLQAFARRSGIDLGQFHSCLELGAGVGRVTRWLAPLFPRVIAVDISSAHLAILATELTDDATQTMLLKSADDIDAAPEFDVFFSMIVLQHNPPPIMALLLRKILSRLKQGGVGYFQIPTYKKGYAFDAAAYLNRLPAAGEMEMHVLPQPKIFQIAAECGCSILEVREDGCTGDIDGVSNTFFLQKN